MIKGEVAPEESKGGSLPADPRELMIIHMFSQKDQREDRSPQISPLEPLMGSGRSPRPPERRLSKWDDNIDAVVF